ncbi:hypothetical protein IJJ18_03370 [Candidatus Saccharibacteria bacterium]|nr:hypothetical protein [Candidatus Saccharibacteria bacterium]
MIKVNRVLAATGLALAGAFVPLAGLAHADTYTYTVSFTASGTHTLATAGAEGIQVDGSDVITLTAPGASPMDPPEVIGTAACADTTHCSITVTDGPTGELMYNGANFAVKTTDECGIDVGPDYRINRDVALSVADPEASLFTGKVWFFWNCDDGFCKQLITGITGTEDDEDPFTGQHHFTYHTKWVDQTTINDGGKTPSVATLSDDDYRIIWEVPGNTPANDASIDTWAKYTAWEEAQLAATGPVTCTNGEGNSYQVDPSYDKLKQLRIDPTGASKGKSIISTNGDRAFRLTIYDPSTYFGVTNASNPSDLEYWPDFWDEGMFNPAYDLSGTTAAAPQTMQAYLLGDTVTLRADEKSAPISGISIASEGVSAAAVTISQSGANWNLKFNSNYYDKVVFKITAGGQDRYLQINRLNVLAVTPDPYNGNTLGARAYIPTPNDGEFDVVATYYYASGSSKTTLLEKSGNAQGAGKNLKAQMYKVPASAGITMNGLGAGSPVGVSFTIVRAGSTPTNYKGTLAGSGRGVYYTFDRSGTIFGKAF